MVTAEVSVMTQKLAKLYKTDPKQLRRMKSQSLLSLSGGLSHATPLSSNTAATSKMQKLGIDIRYSSVTE